MLFPFYFLRKPYIFLYTIDILNKKHVNFDQGLDFLCFFSRDIETNTGKSQRKTTDKEDIYGDQGLDLLLLYFLEAG